MSEDHPFPEVREDPSVPPGEAHLVDKPTGRLLARLSGHIDLEDWQVEILERIGESRPLFLDPTAMAIASRRAQKAAAQREWLRLSLALGEHVHVVEVGGKLTCANGTCTPEQLTPPPRSEPVPAIFDEWSSAGPDDA